MSQVNIRKFPKKLENNDTIKTSTIARILDPWAETHGFKLDDFNHPKPTNLVVTLPEDDVLRFIEVWNQSSPFQGSIAERFDIEVRRERGRERDRSNSPGRRNNSPRRKNNSPGPGPYKKVTHYYQDKGGKGGRYSKGSPPPKNRDNRDRRRDSPPPRRHDRYEPPRLYGEEPPRYEPSPPRVAARSVA